MPCSTAMQLVERSIHCVLCQIDATNALLLSNSMLYSTQCCNIALTDDETASEREKRIQKKQDKWYNDEAATSSVLSIG